MLRKICQANSTFVISFDKIQRFEFPGLFNTHTNTLIGLMAISNRLVQ